MPSFIQYIQDQLNVGNWHWLLMSPNWPHFLITDGSNLKEIMYATSYTMLSNCSAGEDSWEPLGQHRDQTS